MGSHTTVDIHLGEQVRGASVTELTRLKHLEEENRQLKQLFADLSLEKQASQEILRKKQLALRRDARQDRAQQVKAGANDGRVRRGLSRARYTEPSPPPRVDDTPVQEALRV